KYLSDVIGPRLTGSAAARRANDWTLERFKAYGLDARLEPWQFGGTWTRGPMRVRMTAPRAHDVMAASWAWAPGTGGATVTGPVVRIDATTPDSFAVHRGRVKQAWVMTRAPSLVWNNDGPLMTAADSQRQRDFFRTVFTPFRDADSVTRARMQQFANDLPYLLRRGGAHHRPIGITAEAQHPLRPVHRGGAGLDRVAQVRRGARRRGRLDPGGYRARQRDRRDLGAGAAGTDRSGRAVARGPGSGGAA